MGKQPVDFYPLFLAMCGAAALFWLLWVNEIRIGWKRYFGLLNEHKEERQEWRQAERALVARLLAQSERPPMGISHEWPESER